VPALPAKLAADGLQLTILLTVWLLLLLLPLLLLPKW
jgi:hypothetical protein